MNLHYVTSGGDVNDFHDRVVNRVEVREQIKVPHYLESTVGGGECE